MTTPGTGRQGGFLRLSLPSSHLDPLAFNSLKWLPLAAAAAAVVDVGVPLDAAGASFKPAALRCRAALLLSVLRWSEMAIIHFINIRHRRSSPLLIVNKEALSQPTPADGLGVDTRYFCTQFFTSWPPNDVEHFWFGRQFTSIYCSCFSSGSGSWECLITNLLFC